jgi:ribose transport system substrate-binding protein
MKQKSSVRRSMRPRGLVALVAALTLAAAALAGCSSGGETTTGSGGSTAGQNADAQAALDKAYKGLGSDLSDLAPVSPKKGLTFYAISCGESSTSCAVPAHALVDAAEAAGWAAHLADGKLNPSGFAAAIRQAIAGGANVIVPVGFGCSAAQAAFKEAHDAGIMIVGGGGPDDCDPKLWAAERLWLHDMDGIPMWNTFGSLSADWAFGKTNGDVKAITLTGTTNIWGTWMVDGFKNELKKLGSGDVVGNVDISDPEAADGSFIQKVTTALLANPGANVLYVAQGGWLSNGLYQAIAQSGRSDLVVATSLADDATMDLIRSGTSKGIELGAVAQALEWGAWGSVDTAIRLLAGQDPVYIGESMQAVDADHNLPASGAYSGSTDWKSKFRASWGKG